MTFPAPILASAFVLAGAALLALRCAVLTANQSLIKVRSDQRRSTKSRG